MINLIYNILVISSVLSVLVPLTACLIKKRTFNRQLNVLFLYLVVSLSTELISTSFRHQFLSLAFTVVECTLISYIFWLELEKKIFRMITGVLYLLFFLLTVFSIFYLNPHQTDTVSSTAEAIIIISLGILYFFKIFSDLNIPKLTNYYYFWLNSAFLLYFSTALFLFLFKSFIQETGNIIGQFLWGIHLIINITSNILLTLGICKHRKT